MPRKTKENIIIDNKEFILKLLRGGYTNLEIIDKLGICEATYYKYMKQYPELNKEFNNAKIIADMQVDDSMFKRATGYDIIEEEIEYYPADKDGKTRIKTIKRKKKHVPGDVTAQIWWKKNRNPDKWSTRQEIEHSIINPNEAKKAIEEIFLGPALDTENPKG